MLLIAPVMARAQFHYITISGTIRITGYTGPGGDVTIPATIGGLPVTSIGSGAFQESTTLRSITIPGGVTSIGTAAFADSSLAAFTIPDSVTNIGSAAFESCDHLTNIVIPGGITGIAPAMFASCSSLTNVTIPIGVASIGGGAFESCTNLAGVNLPDGLASIGNDAFYGCASLAGITIPASVTAMGDGPFAGCASLSGISVDSQNPAYASVDGVLFTIDQTTLIQCPGGLIGGYAIPDGVLNIGANAFDGCDDLTSVTISGSVTNIGDSAFDNTGSLTAITVAPSSLSYSSPYGVLLDHSHTILIRYPSGKTGAYVIPKDIVSIATGAFAGCPNLTGVTIPDNVACIGTNAFENCENLANLTIADGVTAILDQAFEFCNGLTNVTIPASVTHLGTSAFTACDGLTNVTILGGVTNFGLGAFADCAGLRQVTLAAGITNIGDSAFQFCASLKDVYFLGNAPINAGTGANVFLYAPATVYYLPGTTGWSSTFDGVPAVLWKPLIRSADPGFGIQNNQFGFNITGTSNMAVVVVTANNTTSPSWTALKTVRLTNGLFHFSEPAGNNAGGRFYRLALP